MAESKSLLQPVEDDTRQLARRLIRSARYAALAVVDPVHGGPLVTRTALATDLDGSPILLVSALSTHTQALLKDARCSLLLGEPGKGDPLAHPRITLQGQAHQIARDHADAPRIRRRYLSRLPKAALYVDFGDFSFWRIEPQRASLNGGFGRAFELTASDVLSPVGDAQAWDVLDAEACEHMNQDHAPAVQTLAHVLGKGQGEDWRMTTLDPHGFELAHGDAMVRLEFEQTVEAAQGVHEQLMGLLAKARKGHLPQAPSNS